MADLIERDALLLKQKAHAALFADSTLHDDIVRRDEATAALAEIINAPAVNRWISVEDALPEQGERVIVAIFGSDMIMPNEGETMQDAIERSRKEGYITVGFIGSDGWYGADWFPLMVHPSYWMPKPDLPEPPEKE